MFIYRLIAFRDLSFALVMRKGLFACRLAILWMCLTSTLRMNAQVIDDFSDGDLSLAPSWEGDTGQFVVSGGFLQLNSTGSDSSFIVTSYSTISDTMEWRVKVKMSFSPSSSNYARYYLFADNSNLEGPQQGYFLQFGESGSADAVVLYKQDGWVLTPLIRGTDSAIANSFFVNIKILRYPGTLWKMFIDYSAGENYILEGSVIDAQFNSFSYVGIKTVYTSSNANKFYLDDVYVGRYLNDTIPPSLSLAKIETDSTIKIVWSELVDSITVFLASNYFIDGVGSPISIIQDLQDVKAYYLKFNFLFFAGSIYHLGIVGVEDRLGNVYSDTLHYSLFTISDALVSDLIITEVMSNPTSAPSLPPYEYLEIYNRSQKIIDISSYSLSDPSTIGSLPDDTLFPNEYRLYTSSSDLIAFQNYGITNAIGLSTFPSLNNEGDRIRLLNSNGLVIDEITYDLSMYNDPLRDDHGWSLERIDVGFSCSDKNNWGASHDPSGGTPGSVNSIDGFYQDTISPWPIYAFPIDSMHLDVGFSEFLDTVHANNFGLYFMDQNLGYPVSIQISADQPNLILQLSQPLTSGIIYKLQFDHSIQDCAGNKLKRWNYLDFALPDSFSKEDVKINEILFNPFSEGCDFIEIYNCSEKAIDLSQLKIAHADPIDGIATDAIAFSLSPRLLLPKQFAVAASDPNSVSKFYNVVDSRTLIPCALPSFNDDEGIVVLMSTSLLELERFHYKDDFHFSLLSDPEGVSLERISPSKNVSDSSNWHSASFNSGFATPCKINSQYYDDINDGSSWIKLSPELFSPDNDGYHDVLGITCTPPKPGYMVALSIYNEYGAPVRKLTEHELLGSEGMWIWNGLSDDNSLQPSGIYIALLEMFHIDGDVKKVKKAFVLAKRDN
jgi:Lamin Tail Domain/CHU_C Type IX secretion signal domain